MTHPAPLCLPAPGQTSLGRLDSVSCCDALVLCSALADASIDLIVTSPPYDNLRTYNGFSWNFELIARESYRVLKPGGALVWVVGDATVNGSETLSSFRQAIELVSVGFRLHDTMIWHKDGSPSPQKTRYLQTFEYMFVLAKGSPKSSNLARQKVVWGASKSATFRSDGENRIGFKYAIGNETRVMDNVWYVPSGYMKSTTDIYAYGHPAIFPEALAERHILTWSNPGDVVLDYFAGSGTTLKMARYHKRHYIGCDISAEYCDLMRERLRLPFEPHVIKQETSFEGLPMFDSTA